MDNLTRAFLTKLAQTSPGPVRLNVTGANVGDPRGFGNQLAQDVNAWGHRLDAPEFQDFETQNPARAANVREAQRLAAWRAANPTAQFSPEFKVEGRPGLMSSAWTAAQGMVPAVKQRYAQGVARGPSGLIGAAVGTGMDLVNRGRELYGAYTDPQGPQAAKMQEQALQGFREGFDPYSPMARRYTSEGTTNYLSNKFKDWTGRFGKFGGGLNSVLQLLLGLFSKVPGYDYATTWLSRRFGDGGGLGLEGNRKTASLALPSPYSHYRRVATMPCGTEILERWNRN